MRLWDSEGQSVDAAILAFTVGDDPKLDQDLLVYDCIASAAHAGMLAAMDLLSNDELRQLNTALASAFNLAQAGDFEISTEQEDCHTALEQFLTAQTGELGKRIHTGRSRNDQVIMATRLLVRHRLLGLADSTAALVGGLLQRSEEHREVIMPGYTHTRQGMPSTVGQLFAAIAEGLIRNIEAFHAPLAMANRSALGSASGYGVPLPLQRPAVAKWLGLNGCDINSIAVQNSRGLLEAATLFALHQLSMTLGRFASDLVWFSSEAFEFFSLPTALTTGSSIMPQKRNPDVFELVRAVPAQMLGRYTAVSATLHGVGSGYHRDLQRTKGPMLAGLAEATDVVAVMNHATGGLKVNEEACRGALRPELFATDAVYAEVRGGKSFREAYRSVKGRDHVALSDQEVLQPRNHLGAPGTSQQAPLEAELQQTLESLAPFRQGHAAALALLHP